MPRFLWFGLIGCPTCCVSQDSPAEWASFQLNDMYRPVADLVTGIMWKETKSLNCGNLPLHFCTCFRCFFISISIFPYQTFCSMFQTSFCMFLFYRLFLQKCWRGISIGLENFKLFPSKIWLCVKPLSARTLLELWEHGFLDAKKNHGLAFLAIRIYFLSYLHPIAMP